MLNAVDLTETRAREWMNPRYVMNDAKPFLREELVAKQWRSSLLTTWFVTRFLQIKERLWARLQQIISMHNGSAQPSCIPPASSTLTSLFTIAVWCMESWHVPETSSLPDLPHEWHVQLRFELITCSYFSNMRWFHGVDLWDVSWESTLGHST